MECDRPQSSQTRIFNGGDRPTPTTPERESVAIAPLLEKAIALNLLKQGFPMEAIAQATGLTLAQMQQLQSENPWRSYFSSTSKLR
jgi:hypothetical protein